LIAERSTTNSYDLHPVRNLTWPSFHTKISIDNVIPFDRQPFKPRQPMKLHTITIVIIAILFLGLRVDAQENKPTPGKQVEMSFKTSDDAEVPYLLYLPKDYQADGDKKSGLMLFLHGRGESNGPLSLVAKWGPPKFAARGDELRWIIVSPQCPKSDRWESETQQKRVTELLHAIIHDHNVDESRVFLTGLSMGGSGTWTMAANQPDRFAAVAPICGGGDPEQAEKLKDVPIWVFHGDQDKVVPFEKSVKMIEAIRAAGGTKIRFTSMENIGHNCWSAAYATPELYKWMEQQVGK
jgi:predicted peptidase